MTHNYALKWLDVAKRTPSGGNAQPWRVHYAEDTSEVTFRLSLDPDYLKNKSSMDVKGVASILSLGCLSLNLLVLAQHDGFKLVRRIIPACSEWSEGSVVLVFHKTQVKVPDWAIEDIQNRHTNRTRFIRKNIPPEILNSMKKFASQYAGVQVQHFGETKNELVSTLAILERIRWQNPVLLRSVLKEINFGKNIKLAKDGIPSTQLGADLVERALLRMIRRFPKARALFKTPAVNLAVRKGTVNFISEADSVFILQAKENTFSNFLELGECFQGLWLEAHKHRIAFQPMGTPLVALGYWLDRDVYNFTAKQKNEIEEATKLFDTQFDLDFKKPMIGFRIGYASKETQRSPRKDIKAERDSNLSKAQLTAWSKRIPSEL